ncbi:helix-turn-helix domain-containing protein [Halostella salina]|uniref:helix-turn-helix domain-containing protein n=1 Tax=Halostella salina TaxID=1547897 RepID=UPI0013CE48A4|nr:helix-turn-helix domain-containing protein [Halostella salina]
MRYVTVVLYPDPEALHPVEQQLAESSALERQAIHAFEELADGTVAMLAEVEGDLARYHDIAESSPAVYEYAVSGDSSGYCYSRVDATPLLSELLDQQRTAEFVVDMPIEYTDDGGQRVTMIGRETDFAGGPFDLPESVDIELVSTGSYAPDAEGVFAGLTDRQRTVLEAALRAGYYENPRKATHGDIADELGITSSTVGDHLRAIESRVFSGFLK